MKYLAGEKINEFRLRPDSVWNKLDGIECIGNGSLYY